MMSWKRKWLYWNPERDRLKCGPGKELLEGPFSNASNVRFGGKWEKIKKKLVGVNYWTHLLGWDITFYVKSIN